MTQYYFDLLAKFKQMFKDALDAPPTTANTALPAPPTIKISRSALASVGLEHILNRGGAGDFVTSMVKPLLDAGTLFRLKEAPIFARPFLVYQEAPLNIELLATAIRLARRNSEITGLEQWLNDVNKGFLLRSSMAFVLLL